jgi:hypothetical protein
VNLRRFNLRACIVPLALVDLVLVGAIAQADDHANAAAQATLVKTDGTAVAGKIEVGGDRDWFRFDASAGVRYRISTTVVGSMDTVISVFGPAGSLGEDDDSGGGYASRLEVQPGAGNVTIQVRHYSGSATGTYGIKVEALGAPPPPVVTPVTPAPASGIAVAAARVFDPKLANAALTIGTSATGGAYQATITIHSPTGALVRTIVSGQARQDTLPYSDAWDGRDSAGRFPAVGAYGVRLSVQRGANVTSQEIPVSIVRLGARALKFLDDQAGEPRAKLVYHRATNSAGSYFALDSVGASWTLAKSALSDSALDDATGAPLFDPAPWTNLAAPPRDASGAVVTRGRSLPVAYRQGAVPHVSATLGDGSVANGVLGGSGYPVAGVPIRVSAGGAFSAPIVPGTPVTLELAALPLGVRRLDLNVDLRFQYQDGTTWRDVPGVQPTRHRVYTVLGPSRMTTPASGLAWVAVLDQVAGWSAGTGMNAASTLGSIVRGVNGSGLRYDVVMGASAYALGGTLTNPDLDLSAFVDRRNGTVVNCSDCASVVSTYARQIGIDTEVAILGWNFDLYWIKGIGGTKFIHDLFGGYHGFSYHAVATVDAAQTIHDACLMVDDDSRPDLSPFVERLPIAMPFARYRQQLSPNGFSVDSRGKTTAR